MSLQNILQDSLQNTLQEQLKSDLIQAMKDKDQITANTIRRVNSLISDKLHSASNVSINENDIIDIITKEVKMRNDSIELFKQGNRLDLISQAKLELEILKKYLPEQLSFEAIYEIIKKIIANFTNPTKKDMGNIMKLAMNELKGKADNKTISSIIIKFLK